MIRGDDTLTAMFGEAELGERISSDRHLSGKQILSNCQILQGNLVTAR